MPKFSPAKQTGPGKEGAMDKNIWLHPFALSVVKNKLHRRYRKSGATTSSRNPQTVAHWYSTANNLPTVDPWIRLFDDPALNEALDRFIVCNRIV
jgi:hypothetical protein